MSYEHILEDIFLVDNPEANEKYVNEFCDEL